MKIRDRLGNISGECALEVCLEREPVEIDFLDEEDYFKISSNCFYVMYANDWKH